MAMGCCDPFDVPVPDDLPGAIAHLQSLIVNEGGQFTGDTVAGRFSGASPLGAIEGRYTVQGESIRITITSKPMFVPCVAIEAKIRKYFA